VRAVSRAAALRRLATLAVALGIVALVWATFQPLAGEGGDRVRVAVPRGASLDRIADVLDTAGVIESKALFEVRATLAGKRSDLRSGVYYLREDMSYGDVLDRLSAGPALDVAQVTIPEGLSRREIGSIVRSAGLRGDYAEASANVALLPRRTLRITESPETLEGFLFPATYEFLPRTTTKQLVNKQIAAFNRAWEKVDLEYAKSKKLTAYDVVIIASMVEKETLAPEERPLVAAVIYNRLKAGMTLGIDATLRYGLDIPPTESIRQSQLDSDNPYNTRKLLGLPPTPIANPGLASLQAAAHPADVDYLYFARNPDKETHFFTANEAEFCRFLADNGYGGC
jgi:UPF0755 protein